MGLLDDVLMRKQKPFLDIDELMKGKSEPLPDGYNFSKMNTNAAPSPTNFDYSEISAGGTQPTLPSYDPTRVSSTGRIQNRLPEWQELAEGKGDSLSSPRSLGATRTAPAPFPAPSAAPAPTPAPPMRPPSLRPPMDFAQNNGPPVPPTKPAAFNQTSMLPPTRPEGLGGPPLPPSRQLALGEPNLPRVPDVPPPNIPRGMLAPPPEIASTRAAGDAINAGPDGPVKAPMNRSLDMKEIPKGFGYWDDGTVRNAQGQSAPIFGPTRGEAASDILSKINPAAGSASLPALGSAAKTINTIDSTAIKPAIQSGMLGPTSPVSALNSAVGATGNVASKLTDSAPPVGSAIPGQKDKDEDSAMPNDSDFAKDGSSEGEGGISDSDFDSGGDTGGIMDSDFAGGMGDMMGGMGGGMGGLGGILGLVGSLAGGGKKKDEGFDPPPKAPSVPPPGASVGPEMQRQSQEMQMGQKIMAGILSGDTTSLLQRRRPYA